MKYLYIYDLFYFPIFFSCYAPTYLYKPRYRILVGRGLNCAVAPSAAQVLEGSQTEVDDLFERIKRDVRHYNITLLTYGPVAARYFAQWSMAFHAASPARMAQVRGYFDPERQLRPWGNNLLDEQLFDIIREFVHPSVERA